MSKHMMKILRAMAFASPLLLLSGCGGGGGDVFATPGTTPTDGTTPTPASCQNQFFSGTGSKVTSDFTNIGGATKFTLTHTGTSNFAAWLKEKPSGQNVELLINEIGVISNYEKSVALDSTKIYYIDVTADGSWEIKVENDSCDQYNTPTTPPGQPAAISFQSAEPKTLALQGVAQAGLTQSSVIKFNVVDAAGTPTPGIKVNFSLTTTLGGITLSTPSTVTDSTGLATVTVTAGTVATPVSVVAVVDGTNYRAQSSELNISTGVADQDSFSISVSTFNPEGQDFDGVTSEITARLADRFNNPVPDGTVVQFTTNAGSIEPRCTTSKGACSVQWTSQAPKVAGEFAILAFAVGEESFDDTNSDGRFDAADGFNLSTHDIPEPWLDADLNGIYSSGEVFRDFNGDGVWNDKNGLFNGWLCDDTTRCASSSSLFVFDNVKLVMADSDAVISSDPTGPISLTSTATTKDTKDVWLTIQGANGLVLPAETKIEITTTHGTIKDGGSYTVPNTTEGGQHKTTFPFTIEGKGEAGSGKVKITVTTPKGVVTIDEISVSETVTPAT